MQLNSVTEPWFDVLCSDCRCLWIFLSVVIVLSLFSLYRSPLLFLCVFLHSILVLVIKRVWVLLPLTSEVMFSADDGDMTLIHTGGRLLLKACQYLPASASCMAVIAVIAYGLAKIGAQLWWLSSMTRFHTAAAIHRIQCNLPLMRHKS